ncbi:MAG: hypothetical protein KH357_12890 [Clostridiales bacterium]|nr:hypothetical protein [Clostridiales bacterium]
MKRNMNLKATAGILLAQATMLGAIAAPTVTALADEGDAKQFTVATVRWTDAWPNDFLKEGVMAEMEEKAGVDLDWQIYYNSDWSEQKSLLLASGELPDAFVGSICLNSSDMAQNKDYFVDLTPYINEETMPNLTKAMEECPELRAACTDRDGKIYSLPKKLPLRPTVCGNGLYILSVWGCMVSRNTNYMGLNNDGEAVFVPAQENYKEAVKWMHMLWENGVLDPEYFTQDTSSVTAKLQAEGGSKVGIISAWTADSEAGQNADQYSLMEAVEGYNDIHYVECATASLDITDRELVITTACEDPEALLKWADNFYDDLVSLQTFYGSLGVTVTANDDGTYSVHSTDDDTSLDTAAWSNALRDFGPKYMNPEFYDKVIIPDDVSDGIKLKEDEVNAKYVTTDKNTGMPALQYTEDELNRITAIGTDVYSYVESMYAHWVVDGGVEDEWDSYIDQLNAMGLEELVSLQQGAYAAYLESME